MNPLRNCSTAKGRATRRCTGHTRGAAGLGVIGLALHDRPQALSRQGISRRGRLRGPLGQVEEPCRRSREDLVDPGIGCVLLAVPRGAITSGSGEKRLGPSADEGRGSRARTEPAAWASPARPILLPGPSGRSSPSEDRPIGRMQVGGSPRPLPDAGSGAEGSQCRRATRSSSSDSLLERVGSPAGRDGNATSLRREVRRFLHS